MISIDALKNDFSSSQEKMMDESSLRDDDGLVPPCRL